MRQLSFVSLVLVLLLQGCLTPPSAANLAAPERDRLTVTIPAPTAQVVDRVVAAFLAESLQVASSEGGVVTARPLTLKSIGVDVGLITYTATVVRLSDSTSQAVVMALHRDLAREGSFGQKAIADAREEPVTSRWRAMFVPHWERVERIGARLERRLE